jgi:hypothetical protein
MRDAVLLAKCLLLVELVRRTRSSTFLVPPLFDAFLTNPTLVYFSDTEQKQDRTYLMKLAPAHQSRHLIPGFILLEADNALLFIPVRIHAVLLRSYKRKHAARGMRDAVRTARLAGRAHAAGSLRGQTRRCSVCERCRNGRGRVHGDASFDVLGSGCFVVARTFGGEFVAADGAFVFFGDLTARARCGDDGWRHGRGVEYRAGEHVDDGLGARAEIEGHLAIVGRRVAGGGRDV